MSTQFHTVEQVRRAEEPLIAALPDGAPMRRAATGLAVVVARELRERVGAVGGSRVLLLVGSGDNGADALWAGAFLARRGVAVSAILLDPARAHRAGLAALQRAGGRVVDRPSSPDLVIDGIVGISGRGPLRPRAAAIVAALDAPIVAVDLPSGVDADTGAVSGPAVRAQVTVAFGALKPVHALAGDRCGTTVLVPIGLNLPPSPIAALTDDEVGRLWPVPGADDDKYTQGVVGIVAGSGRYPGAAVLSVSAAVAATSGMVRYVGPVADAVVFAHPEVVVADDPATAGRVQAWVIGPGAGTDDAALQRLTEVLASEVPVLVDADALTVLAARPHLVAERAAPTLLTPHDREFARLAGHTPGHDRVAAVRELAAQWDVTVLLKGRATIVADPDGSVLINDAGSSWASTAGSGDVLSGVVGSLLAGGLRPATAAAAGARVHSIAAAIAASGAPTSASGISAALSAAIRRVRG